MIFLYIFETIYAPFYFENMRGLKQDLEMLYALLEKDYEHIIQFLRGHEYLLDHFFMNWLVCLFMSLDLNFKRKFEILQYIIQFKKRGLFRLTIFVLSENEDILLSCTNFAEIESKVKDFYLALEDPFLFARLKRLQMDETVLKEKIRDYDHEFDPDQYVLVDHIQENPKDWVIRDYFFLDKNIETK